MTHANIEQLVSATRRKVGGYVFTVLADGYMDVDFAMLTNISGQEAKDLLAGSGRDTAPRITVAAFLLQGHGQTILIDGGDASTASTGRAMSALTAAGVSCAEVDRILLTHAHPDHVGCLATSNGVARFPNAELVVQEQEFSFWQDDAAMSAAPDLAKPFFSAARNTFAAYSKQMSKITGGDVAHGVTAIPLAGHTPGHQGFLIESEGERLFLWGDITHIPDIQIPRPDVGVIIDVDPLAAMQTRLRALDMAASERLPVAGPHIPFPGVLRVSRNGDSYSHTMEPWSPVP